MPWLRIALAQANPTVGDLDGNADRIVAWSHKAADAGADLVVFPEMMLTGYPVEDLALRASFRDASIAKLHATAARLASEGIGDLAVVIGYLDHRRGVAPRTGLPSGAPLDAAALIYRGDVAARTAKHHLPNYGVFDEYRYFLPGDITPVFRMSGGPPGSPGTPPAGSRPDPAPAGSRPDPVRPGADGEVDVAIAVCEDLWQDGGPVALARQAGAGLLVVPNASPYEHGKEDVRRNLCVRRAHEAGATLAYVNMTGAQDELVFDGDSIIVDPSGRVLARGPQFADALVVADVELPAAGPAQVPGEQPADACDGTTMTISRLRLPAPAGLRPRPAVAQAHCPRLPEHEEIYTALVTGVRDYVRKNGFRSVILGLSGGIDSALTATIAADALGPDLVHVVLMPSRYSTEHSVSDAEDLVKRQGLRSAVVPVRGIVDAFDAELDLHGLAAENLQARIRGTILMSLSNEHGHLVLTTGNKSEIATGYSTLYGDSAGGFAPIKDVPKTLVWQLARWRDTEAASRGETPPIPENSITKPPSAELAPGQLDSDRLPDYAMLDRLLDDYVVKDMGATELAAAGHDPQLIESVIRMVDHAEYKRRQYPPGPKITPKNFGRDRRLPITNRWRERRPDS
jgi:NAD+ synthase (glutamine-hydrolysing)